MKKAHRWGGLWVGKILVSFDLVGNEVEMGAY